MCTKHISNRAMPNQAISVDENSVEAISRRECQTMQNNDDRISGLNFVDFPYDIQDCILAKLNYEHLFQFKAVSKGFKTRIEDDEFHCLRGNLRSREGLLTALHFSVRQDGVWRCAGYDLDTKAWTKLPPFAMLPCLDTNLFKDHLICGDGGLLCVCVSSTVSFPQTSQQKIIVLNPLTGRWWELPPLNHSRNPVLVHMIAGSTGDWFKVIVAGSARVGEEHLSKTTEVFDSRTSMWAVTGDLPGPVFALNEHQNGAYRNGLLYCIAFLDWERGRGLLAYNVDEGIWLPHLACPLPYATNLNVMQVANINGEIVVFSEVERIPYNPRRTVEHRIDILENVMPTDLPQGATGMWRNVMTQIKAGSQAGLQIYPENTCIPFEDGKFCLFNTITHSGVIYDMSTGKRTGKLMAPTWDGRGDMNFYSFNPPTFCFAPSFKSKLERKLQLPEGSAKSVLSLV